MAISILAGKMSNDAKLTPHKFVSEEIHPDWSMIVSNQLTLITQQSAMLENQRSMIETLQKIADTTRLDRALEHQGKMIQALDGLGMHVDTAREELEVAVQKLSAAVLGIIKVPIVVVMISIASLAFFWKFIGEHTWLILLGVAVFPYLGDSITAVAKLFGIGRQNRNE
jgi:hypothetical protein